MALALLVVMAALVLHLQFLEPPQLTLVVVAVGLLPQERLELGGLEAAVLVPLQLAMAWLELKIQVVEAAALEQIPQAAALADLAAQELSSSR